MAIETYEANDRGLFVPVDYARSLENPAVPLSDPRVLENFGYSSHNGSVPVTERSILQFGPFYRAVNLLSDSFASLPLDVMLRMQPRGKQKAVAHPAYRALRRLPNRRQTAFIFKKQMQAAALIYGNGYAYIDRSNPRKTQLLFLLPDRTRPYEDEDGTLWYETFIRGGRDRRVLFPDEVLHLRGLSEDGGMTGLPLVQLLKRTAQLGLSAEKYGIKFFDNGARASGVLTYPPKMSKPAQRALRESVKERKTGLDNASKVMVLSEGAKWQPLTINQDEAQFLETRMFQAREVAVWFGIPPNKLGDTTRTSYNSLEQENQAYLDEGVNPWLCNFEDECWDKLLSESEKESDSHVIEFNRRGFVRADLTARMESYAKGIQSTILSPDEAREAENLNPIPDGEGEKFFRPLNMVVVGEEPPDDTNTGGGDDTEEDSDAPARYLLLDALRRLAGLEISAIERATKRKSGLSIDQECEKHRDRMAEVLTPILAVVAPENNAADLAARWHGETVALVNAGAAIEMMAEHRCAATVTKVFEDKP